MSNIPVFKRLSTWANIVSVVAASVMASPLSVSVPDFIAPFVWPVCCILVAVCQAIKQNQNEEEWI